MRLLLTWLLLALPVFADQFDGIRDFIRSRMAAEAAPSVAVAVARDGRILWEEGFGWADREKRVAANEHTMYSLASITKPFTATGLMTLVEQKRADGTSKIDLDRPINQYLGNAKLRARVGNADDATVRRVAMHTSGLPLHYQFFYEDEPYRLPSMDETILRYGNLVTIPGEKYEYSNLGYGILGYVIARVSGETYEDYMRKAVFLRLGLTHTSVGIGKGLEKFAAVRYGSSGSDGPPIPFFDFNHRGAGAIYSSAHDLIRFAMFHLGARLPGQARILSDASIAEMQKFAPTRTQTNGYGIGWFVNRNVNGYDVVTHTGGMNGVATFLHMIPSEKLAIVVLCNANVDLPGEVAEKLLAAMLPNWKARPSQPPRPPAPLPPALKGTWTGALSTYKADIPLVLRVLDSGEVHAQLGRQIETLLTDVKWEPDPFSGQKPEDVTLSGRMPGDIGIEEASRRPYYLQFNLKLRGNLLNGSASAISQPGRRDGSGLTQWVELKKD
jgi:CubicO group peptidase (beta-lactamase class C family)